MPSGINKQCLLGPQVYYDCITDAQARLLGVDQLPGVRCRCSKRGPGWTARRLQNGKLRVVLDARLLRDHGAASFIARMQHYCRPIRRGHSR